MPARAVSISASMIRTTRIAMWRSVSKRLRGKSILTASDSHSCSLDAQRRSAGRSLASLGMVISILMAACSGTTGGALTAPSTSNPTPIPTTAILSGHLTATNGGQPLSGESISLGSASVTTDASGAFSSTLPFGSLRVSVSGPGVFPRSLMASLNANRDLPLDVIAIGGGFDATFYRQFVRNTFDAPAGMEPLRRWTRAPTIYLKTVDEAGVSLDAATLNATEQALRETVPLWTAGAFDVTIQRGTGTMVNQAGFVTVMWANPAESNNSCGHADVGREGGSIVLNYKNTAVSCRCPGTEIYPRLVRHELGHAMGFWHTDSSGDVMFGGNVNSCDALPSARERYHAAISYKRVVGNLDPDTDPLNVIALAPMRVQ